MPCPAGVRLSRRLLCAALGVQVEDSTGNVIVAQLPAKFRKVIWIKRGAGWRFAPVCQRDACG